MDILHKLWGGGHRLCYKPTLPHNKMVEQRTTKRTKRIDHKRLLGNCIFNKSTGICVN
jgi:hypothetical protein